MNKAMQDFFDQLQALKFWLEGIIPLVLVLVAYYAILFILRKLCRKEQLDNKWFQTWRNLGGLAYIIALYQPLLLFVPELSQSLESFGKVFTSPLFDKENGLSLISLLLLLPIFFVSSRLATGLVKLLELHLDRNHLLQKKMSKADIPALLTILYYVLLSLFCLLGINLVGINLSSLGVILGALGLGIGFGLQNIAANFISGITLLLNSHIQSGDFIRTPKAFGTVERVGLMNTIVLTIEHENLIIPNQYLLNEIIENASYENNRIVQLHLPVGVSYESDLDLVVELLKEVLERNPYFPENWEQQKNALRSYQNNGNINGKTWGSKGSYWLKGFETSAIEFEVRMMIENIDVCRAATHWFYMEIWRTFKKHGIIIPFTQIDVHIFDAREQQIQSVTGFGL